MPFSCEQEQSIREQSHNCFASLQGTQYHKVKVLGGREESLENKGEVSRTWSQAKRQILEPRCVIQMQIKPSACVGGGGIYSP